MARENNTTIVWISKAQGIHHQIKIVQCLGLGE